MTSQATPFTRQLASSDSRTRETALDDLRVYLSGKTQLDELELLKLWKGLFYSMWMCDRPVPQQRLARSLAELPALLAPGQQWAFIRAFWTTMAREWSGIDALRMDKFLYLVRCYLGAALQLVIIGRKSASRKSNVKRNRGDGEFEADDAIAEFVRSLEDVPLSVADASVPDGLRYHVLDVYPDELQHAFEEKRDAGASGGGDNDNDNDEVEGVADDAAVDGEATEEGQDGRTENEEDKIRWPILLRPVRRLAKESKSKTVRLRATEALEDARVQRWLSGSAADENAPVEWSGFDDD